MIYITCDIHANFSRFEEDKFQIQTEMTQNDNVIIYGDFVGVRNHTENMNMIIKIEIIYLI